MTNDTHELIMAEAHLLAWLHAELKWKYKTLSKQAGRQGETIHLLRAELTEIRGLHSRIERRQLRELERLLTAERRRNARLIQRYNIVYANNVELREKLADQNQPVQ